ncbi:MAG: hypothetical protein ACOYKA_03015 [Legionellaceae bacterium]
MCFTPLYSELEGSQDLQRRVTPLRLLNIKSRGLLWFKCLLSHRMFHQSPLQILKNLGFIDRVDSHDASIIGVFCGQSYRDLLKRTALTDHPLMLKNNRNYPFKFLSFHRSHQIIEYVDADHNRHVMKLLSLAKNKALIENFPPYHAYYIGFLAGLLLARMKGVGCDYLWMP